MKYAAEDGTLFKTEEECLQHEKRMVYKEKMKERVIKYLSMREYKTEAPRKRAEIIIMSWIDFDMLDRPEAYEQPHSGAGELVESPEQE